MRPKYYILCRLEQEQEIHFAYLPEDLAVADKVIRLYGKNGWWKVTPIGNDKLTKQEHFWLIRDSISQQLEDQLWRY